ncbi:phage tail fiber protein [Symbiopectobacterium sp. Eva_TO]
MSAWYKTGAIAATSGSKIIMGTRTQFTNPLNGVAAGRMLLLPAAGTVQIYEIESVQSDTQLTLVSAFTGTTGTGKAYAIPTSPTVSIEQFAHEFASTLAYYQQQLSSWQQILTGTGNVTLTTPDGQTVTVRSQRAWDTALNGKANSSDVFLLKGALGTNDLNNVIGTDYQGIWWQNATANATAARNYPVVSAGNLLVLYNSVTSYGITQIYITPVSKRIFIRSKPTPSDAWTTWDEFWTSANLPNPATLDTAQNITGLKQYRRDSEAFMIFPAAQGKSSFIRGNEVDGSSRWYLGYGVDNVNTLTLHNYKASNGIYFNENGDISINPADGKRIYQWTYPLLAAGLNAVSDANGFWKTASPVVKLFADGTSELTSEAEGITSERLSEGVYRISGCLGLNADRAWGGDEGGIDVPMCRNKLPRLWVDYGGDEGSSQINPDGSMVIRTYHRPHPDARAFARNEIEGYTNGDPIDIPRDTFISVRVQMPEREELKPKVMHSNVYCNTVVN